MSRRWMWRKGRLLAPAVAAGALALAGGDGTAQTAAKERYTLAGAQIAIFNLAGEVRVEPGTGSEVVIEVDRGGPDAASLRVETGSNGPYQTLRVVYPGARVVYRGRDVSSRTSIEVAPDGTFGDDHGFNWLRGGRRVTVSGFGRGTEAWANLRVLVPKGRTLRLHHAVGEVHVGAIEGDVAVDHCAGLVEVRGVKGRLTVDTGSGEVQVKDVQGDVSLDTGSGSVEVSGARGSRLRIDTGSGSVRASDVTVDALSADTGSGGVDLDGVRASVILLDTGSGQVDLDLLGGVEKLNVDTGSGGVTLTVPTKLGAEFDIETGSGAIDVDVPHQVITLERDHVRGRIGDGHGRIHVDTGSGGVRLLRRTTTSDRSGTVLGTRMLPQVG